MPTPITVPEQPVSQLDWDALRDALPGKLAELENEAVDQELLACIRGIFILWVGPNI